MRFLFFGNRWERIIVCIICIILFKKCKKNFGFLYIDIKNGLLMGWIWYWIKDELVGFKELMNIFI